MTKIPHSSTAAANEPSSKAKKTTIKVVYADKQKGHDEFFLYAFEDELQKWRQDKSVPLVDVVESYDIYTTESRAGSTGKAMRPSKQLLSNTFETANENDIIPRILTHGKVVHVNTQRRTESYEK